MKIPTPTMVMVNRMRASEILEMVRELGMLGRVDRPSDTVLARAYVLMARLRGCGFSSFDVSLLSGRRWDSSLVRKRGKWSGDVDVTGRDELLGLVGEFATDGGTMEELAKYKEAKKLLDGLGFSFDGVVKLVKSLLACRSSVPNIDELSLKLARVGRSAEEVSQRIEVDEE
jgi:hypothetical protein